jgi:hypothetical protein
MHGREKKTWLANMNAMQTYQKYASDHKHPSKNDRVNPVHIDKEQCKDPRSSQEDQEQAYQPPDHPIDNTHAHADIVYIIIVGL